MASVGILVEYQPDEDWEDFADRLGQYFIANKMAVAEDADRRRAVLLTVCGKTTYALMKDLVTPDKPKDKTFDELIEIVARHSRPKPGKIVSPVQVLHSLGRRKVSRCPSLLLTFADWLNIVNSVPRWMRC